MLIAAWFACTPAPAPVEKPAEPATAPSLVPPPAPEPSYPAHVEGAAPMEVVEAIEPHQGAPVSDATLVLSSRGDGEIERCGCPKNPAGGLARRRTLLDEWRAKGTVFTFDAGDSLHKKGMPDNHRARLKAQLIADEWSRMGTDGVAIGAADWGIEGLREMIDELPVVAANLVCGTERPYPAARIVGRGGRTVGVVGLTLGEVEGCTVTDPVVAAREAASLVGNADVTLLLWPDRGEAAHSAGLQGLPYDAVVDASGRFGKKGQPLWAGTTWLVGAGIMTKAVARMDLRFVEGAEGFFPESFEADLERDLEQLEAKQAALDARQEKDDPAYASQAAALRSRRVALDNRKKAYGDGKVNRLTLATVRLTDDVIDDAETMARVNAVKEQFGQGTEKISPAALIARRMLAPEGSEYAGAATCADCHPTEYSQWQKTPHSRALQTLLRTKNHFDESCFTCHVTGAKGGGNHAYPVIVNAPEEIGGMLQVQCEACHGPSAAHIADPTVKPVRKPEASVCMGCHDGVRDEGNFDYATYLPKVIHQ